MNTKEFKELIKHWEDFGGETKDKKNGTMFLLHGRGVAMKHTTQSVTSLQFFLGDLKKAGFNWLQIKKDKGKK